MKFIAILGRQPEFGLVELESVFGGTEVQPFGKTAALLTQSPDLSRLGGVLKVGRVVYEGPTRDLNETPIPLDDLPAASGKTTFGLSYYGVNATQKFVTAAGLTLKKRLKSQGSIRFVAPQQGLALTAAQVKFNSLTRNGFELLVVHNRREMVVAVTEQIQDIDWYAARDYQRPTRSAKVGMLPPKLAQVMVNTTSAPLVYDPFCGTGVILQEALLLGRGAAGSDLAPDMVAATQDNIEWLRSKRPDLPEVTVTEADARTVHLPDEPLAVVSEGYLGPNMSKAPSASDMPTLQEQLGGLYQEALRSWAGQLESGSEVSITVPAWRTPKGWRPLQIVDSLSDLGYTLKRFEYADSRALLYRRPNQFVGRQLLILRKT